MKNAMKATLLAAGMLLAAGAAQDASAAAAACKSRLGAADKVDALNAIQNLMGRYSHLGHLRGEDTLEDVLRVVLIGEVEDLATGAGGVAAHLHGHRRLAEALGAGEQDQVATAEAAGEDVVERAEARRPHPGGSGLGAQACVGRIEHAAQRVHVEVHVRHSSMTGRHLAAVW